MGRLQMTDDVRVVRLLTARPWQGKAQPVHRRMRRLALTMLVQTGCLTVARTHAGVADGPQAQMTTTMYGIEDDDGDWGTGAQAQLDMGWGARLSNNAGIYAGARVAFPWFKTSQLDLYLQGPSTKNVMFGFGVEGGAYIAGPYASLTMAGDQGYMTLTGRVNTPVEAWNALYGGQIAFGLQWFLLYAGYMQDADGNSVVQGGVGFVPEWDRRARD